MVLLALGLTLIIAAALKGHQLWAEPFAVENLFPSRTLAVFAIHAEAALGLWLLSGVFPALARLTILVCFAGFSIVSLHQALSGKPSCGCFGRIPITPWATVVIDLVAIALLAMVGPPAPPPDVTRRVLLVGGLFLAIIPLTMWLLSPAGIPPQLIIDPLIVDLGVVPQGHRREAEVSAFNKGGEQIVIGKVVTSCPCLRVTLQKQQIQSQEIITGKIILDLASEPNFVGDLGVTVNIHSPEGHQLSQFRVSVKVTGK